ncbi:MAG: thioredoxin family protein [Desulfobacula sp.]|nr:thioredoxin family protein [Desulfobacula sp.]
MKIEILGTGCKSCDTLYSNVAGALDKTGLSKTVRLEKSNDIDYFAKMGVFTTPGLVIEGELISSGQVLSEDRIVEILKTKKEGI